MVQNISLFAQFYRVLGPFYRLWSIFRAEFDSGSNLVSSESDSESESMRVRLLRALFTPLWQGHENGAGDQNLPTDRKRNTWFGLLLRLLGVLHFGESPCPSLGV